MRHCRAEPCHDPRKSPGWRTRDCLAVPPRLFLFFSFIPRQIQRSLVNDYGEAALNMGLEWCPGRAPKKDDKCLNGLTKSKRNTKSSRKPSLRLILSTIP